MKWRNDAILKTGVIEIAVDSASIKIRLYRRISRICINGSNKCFENIQTYGKEDFVIYCDMREII